MQLVDLINIFRDEADDLKTPYLWSDSILTTWANEAQIEACRRARLIRSPATINVNAGDQSVSLGGNIIFVRQCNIASKDLPLVRAHSKDLDRKFPGWTTTNYGDVIAFCPDHETNTLWFNSPFPANDVVTLSVIRTPKYDMRQQVITTTGTTTNTTTAIDPEINARYHHGLIHWMLWRAFSKQDSETNDSKKAAGELAQFEAEFGERMSAQDEMYSQEQYGYDDYDGVY